MSARMDRSYIDPLQSACFGELGKGEHLLVSYAAERSHYVRLNGAKVRQAGTVEDAQLDLTWIAERPGGLRKAQRAIPVTGIPERDRHEAIAALRALREEAPLLPVDPYARVPMDHGTSAVEREGRLLPLGDVADAIVPPAGGSDLAGIYASGRVARTTASSAGTRHWFSAPVFSLDYSLYTPSQRALKGCFAGSDWDASAYAAEIAGARERVALLERPARRLERGTYRAYLAPAALGDIVAMFSWGAISEAAIRQGDSPLRLMRAPGGPALSPLFSLAEDFGSGGVPRFNEEGELAPETLPLLASGKLVSSLVSTRSASEYAVPANGASESEMLRSPVVAAGSLEEGEVLARLGTGLYLSNLHYLNWSDQPGGRVTGMTRYACYWVERGEIVAPIENMRFDDSLFGLLGSSLKDLTRARSYLPDMNTYIRRGIGGMLCPGALLGGMTFTI